MRLRREMHHGVDPLGLQEVGNEVARADVALDELEVGLARDGFKVSQGRAVVELVEDNDAHGRVAVDEEADDVRGDKAGATFSPFFFPFSGFEVSREAFEDFSFVPLCLHSVFLGRKKMADL